MSRVTMALFGVLLIGLGSAAHGLNCNTTQDQSSNITLTEDATKDGTGACFRITSSGVTINCAGYSILCETSGGCGTAVEVDANTATIRNCFIEAGSGGDDWTTGVDNADGGTSGHTTTVTNVVVDGATYGVLYPGTIVEHSVFRNIGTACVWTVFRTTPAGGQVTQNFCDSAGFGIAVKGPTSGSFATISRNYVRASSTGIDGSNRIDIVRNVIDVATTYIADSLSDGDTDTNLCDDATDCDEPDGNFDFNANFDLP